MQPIKTAIYGAAGFTGQELIKLLAPLNQYRIVFISSDAYKGQTPADIWGFAKGPNFRYRDLQFSSNSDNPTVCDLVFLATPNEGAASLTAQILGQDDPPKIVDISGAHRIKDQAVFESVYKFEHPAPANVEAAVFGIPETNTEAVAKAQLVANPGCFPTGSIGPITFLMEALAKLGAGINAGIPVIIDAKSGVSGAGGRVEGPGFAFNGLYENFRAYKVLGHQHEPEIAQEVNIAAQRIFGKELTITFTPHLLPLFRGILSTVYLQLDSDVDLGKLQAELAAICEGFEFMEFVDDTGAVELKDVQFTNRVRFGIALRGRQLVLVSAIDNLLKGAAGQALQNANIMCGLEPTLGLP